jgi:hypothetical protein
MSVEIVGAALKPRQKKAETSCPYLCELDLQGKPRLEYTPPF